MAPTDLLHEAEADLAALATLPGEIRARVKAGLAELNRLRDAIDAELNRLADGAKATLMTLRTLPAAEGQAAASDAPPAGGSGG